MTLPAASAKSVGEDAVVLEFDQDRMGIAIGLATGRSVKTAQQHATGEGASRNITANMARLGLTLGTLGAAA